MMLKYQAALCLRHWGSEKTILKHDHFHVDWKLISQPHGNAPASYKTVCTVDILMNIHWLVKLKHIEINDVGEVFFFQCASTVLYIVFFHTAECIEKFMNSTFVALIHMARMLGLGEAVGTVTRFIQS